MTKTSIQKYIKTHFSWSDKHTMNKKMKIPKPLTFEVKEFPEFIGKSFEELKAHLEENYAERLPDISMMEQFEELLPKELWRWYFFFGSTLRDRTGYWNVPCFIWKDGEWDRHAGWLRNAWHGYDRVVLLGISSGSSPVASESGSLDLALRVKSLEDQMESISQKNY